MGRDAHLTKLHQIRLRDRTTITVWVNSYLPPKLFTPQLFTLELFTLRYHTNQSCCTISQVQTIH
ncbi:MAG: hypothetical protein HC903_05645 [Methylacidiphilales bacterium]|nr:hypothetical protein [Candidatus Methylacidiphilales bacterium]